MVVESVGVERLLKLGCVEGWSWGDRGWLEHGMVTWVCSGCVVRVRL